MLKKKLVTALFTLGCLISAPVQAKKLTIIYVPLDNRPVCMDYVNRTMAATDCKLIFPPEKHIATQNTNGNPEAIWNWLLTKAPKADAAVISVDSMIYGGLVASRTHTYSTALLEQRVKRIAELNKTLPIKLYAFSTIMRTPRASKGRVEPPYYSEIGPAIFTYSELLDKADQHRLNTHDQVLKQVLERNLPKAPLTDWLARREKNFSINSNLAYLARREKFHYLAIGKDDNAPLSATHMEARKLALETFDLSPQHFQIIDGVDQLGLLLLTRAYNEAHGLTPKILPVYAPGVGPATLPQYSDARLQDSVPQQILASGSQIANSLQEAQLLLAINTPDNGIVQDSTGDENKFFANLANKQFIQELDRYLTQGYKVSLADISYSNGADNGFMHVLTNTTNLGALQAYNGWNTADNAIGYAISQGLLAAHMSKANKDLLLKERLVDDWFYQSNARKNISLALERNNREDLKYDLGTADKQVLASATKDCRQLAGQYGFTKGMDFQLSFPWKRLFEVKATVRPAKK